MGSEMCIRDRSNSIFRSHVSCEVGRRDQVIPPSFVVKTTPWERLETGETWPPQAQPCCASIKKIESRRQGTGVGVSSQVRPESLVLRRVPRSPQAQPVFSFRKKTLRRVDSRTQEEGAGDQDWEHAKRGIPDRYPPKATTQAMIQNRDRSATNMFASFRTFSNIVPIAEARTAIDGGPCGSLATCREWR